MAFFINAVIIYGAIVLLLVAAFGIATLIAKLSYWRRVKVVKMKQQFTKQLKDSLS